MQPSDAPVPPEPTPNQPTPGPGEPPPQPAPSTPPPMGDSSKDDRTMAMLAHLGGIVTSFIAPLVIWLIKKDQPGFVEDQAKEALNFQITVLMGYIAWMVLSAIPILGCLVMPAGILIFLGALALAIMAAVKANDGVQFRYPVSLRLIK